MKIQDILGTHRIRSQSTVVLFKSTTNFKNNLIPKEMLQRTAHLHQFTKTEGKSGGLVKSPSIEHPVRARFVGPAPAPTSKPGLRRFFFFAQVGPILRVKHGDFSGLPMRHEGYSLAI